MLSVMVILRSWCDVKANIAIEDLIGLAGISLLALALFLLLGWPGVIGYIGALLTTAAYKMAERKRTSGPN